MHTWFVTLFWAKNHVVMPAQFLTWVTNCFATWGPVPQGYSSTWNILRQYICTTCMWLSNLQRPVLSWKRMVCCCLNSWHGINTTADIQPVHHWELHRLWMLVLASLQITGWLDCSTLLPTLRQRVCLFVSSNDFPVGQQPPGAEVNEDALVNKLSKSLLNNLNN